jgi:hypothetical protein
VIRAQKKFQKIPIVQAIQKMKLNFDLDKPPTPHLEYLFTSLHKLYGKLKEFCFTYYNREVSVIDEKEDKVNV